MSAHHDHDHNAPPQDPSGLSRRDVLRRGGLAAGGLLLAAGGTAFTPAPGGRLRGPAGRHAASRASRLDPAGALRLVHADMHNHTLLSDGDGDPANAYALMRERGLDVAALTDHTVGDAIQPGDPSDCDDGSHSCGRVIGLNAAGWSYTNGLADAANDPANGFVAIRGFEWSAVTQGHVNVWFTSEYTDPTLTAGQVGLTAAPAFIAEEGPSGPHTDPLLALGEQSPAPGMAGLYDWLEADPARPGLGGGNDGIAGFNHPGREPGRFGFFGHVAGVSERIVSIEVMNRTEDYLFKGVENGQRSPIQQCLDEGWRVGLLGVTDEHGDDAWGRQVSDTRKGRAGLWVRTDLPYGRVAVKEAMAARRFFATNKSGLRLDLRATSKQTARTVRMGQTLPHRAGAVRFELDVDGILGEAWAGSKPLQLQVLRPSSDLLPEIVHAQDVVVPAPGAPPLAFELPLDVADGDWVFVRLSDPRETELGGEREALEASAFAGRGRAVAYSSPVFLDPDADTTTEAMRRERIAGLR